MITASDILGARIPCFPTPRSGSKDRRAATGRWPAYTNDCWPAPEFLVSGAPVLPSGDWQLSAWSRRSAGEVERRQMAGSGFTTVRLPCRLTARSLTFNRVSRTRAEDLGLHASISTSTPSARRQRGQFKRRGMLPSAAKHQGDSRGTGGETCAVTPRIYAA